MTFFFNFKFTFRVTANRCSYLSLSNHDTLKTFNKDIYNARGLGAHLLMHDTVHTKFIRIQSFENYVFNLDIILIWSIKNFNNCLQSGMIFYDDEIKKNNKIECFV